VPHLLTSVLADTEVHDVRGYLCCVVVGGHVKRVGKDVGGVVGDSEKEGMIFYRLVGPEGVVCCRLGGLAAWCLRLGS
jgi:hypothetical protein